MSEKLNPEKEKAAQKPADDTEKRETEPKTKKCLFIDDNGEILASLKRRFGDKSNVFFAECHSVEEALRANEEYNPDVIFLDHQLTEDGDEGFEIADRIKGKKIYSTTSDRQLADDYKDFGIEYVGKTDLAALRSIIEPPIEEKREKKSTEETKPEEKK